MRFLGTLLIFAGYTFVYAATANHGKFATDPWMGLVADAYTGPIGKGSQKVTPGPGAGGTPQTAPPGVGATPTSFLMRGRRVIT